MRMTASPAILIGFDASDIGLIERLLAEGRLPNLRALRDRGCQARLETRPTSVLSMVWPTFWNGSPVTENGWYFGKMWRPERMRLEHADPEWLPQQPFWRDLPAAGPRLALIDVPFGPEPPPDFSGIALNGWQCHDLFMRYARPAGLRDELVRRFGGPRLELEVYGPQNPGRLIRLRRQMLACTDQIAAICEWLLARERFDLFAVVLGAAHRGGHYLWDLSQIEPERLDAETRRELEGALADIYEACDAAIGRILARAPAGARVLVFALHGMGPNDGWVERFPRIVESVGWSDRAPAADPRLVYRLKRALPWGLVREVTRRLPARVNESLVPLWSGRMYDWRRTRFFPLPSDVNGFVRVNLAGREAKGAVASGADYDALCDELSAAFLRLETVGSGEPVVAAVDRLYGSAPDTDARAYLPDLIVCWNGVPSTRVEGVRVPGHRDVRWRPGRKLPSGRSGNHTASGWLVASGPGIEARATTTVYDAVDLMPTVYRWLGLRPPERFRGRPIPELASASAAAAAGGRRAARA
jgi:predicted AlkP superfamily phosphohydrolase/phosphomutase